MAGEERKEAAVGKRQYWNSGLSQGDWMDEEKFISTRPTGDESAIQQEIASINQSIRRYNTLVPTSILQKSFISIDNVEKQHENWI